MDDINCPNVANHVACERLDVVEDHVYRCDCGCQFEAYGEDALFVMEPGYVKSNDNNNLINVVHRSERRATLWCTLCCVFVVVSLIEFLALIIK